MGRAGLPGRELHERRGGTRGLWCPRGGQVSSRRRSPALPEVLGGEGVLAAQGREARSLLLARGPEPACRASRDPVVLIKGTHIYCQKLGKCR